MGGRRLILFGAILAVTVLLAACGGEDNAPSPLTTSAATLPATTPPSILPIPTAQPGQIRIWASSLADSGHAWVGGYHCQNPSERRDCTGLIFGTDDGGLTWVAQYQGDVVPAQLEFVDSERGMALVYDSVEVENGSCVGTSCDGPVHVLVTQDGGLHWDETYTLPWDDAAGVDRPQVELALSPGDAWIVVNECVTQREHVCDARLLRSRDNGQTWAQTELPIQAFNLHLSRPTTNDAWIHAVAPASLIVSHDAGRTWTRLDVPAVAGPTELFFADDKQGWAVVGGSVAAGSQPKEVFRTRDGGRTWEHLAGDTSWPPTTPTSGSIADAGYVGPIVFTSSTKGWMVLGRLGLLQSSDGGVSWTITYQLGDGLDSVQFVDADHGWATNPNVIIATDDGGDTWRVVPVPTVESQ